MSLATTGVLAYISWAALERPALSLKRYFRYEPPDAPPPVPISAGRGQLVGVL